MKAFGNARKIAAVTVAVIMAMLILVTAASAAVDVTVPDMTEIFYVADYAGVLSNDTVNYICDTGYDLAVQTGAELVVLTVDFLDGLNSEEYANAVFNDWRLGDPQKNNGVLILLAVGEGKYFVAQGSGLENSLSSGTIGTILDQHMEEDFDAGNYDRAVLNTYKELYSRLEKIYGAVTPDYPIYEWEYEGDSYGRDIFLGVLLVAIIMILIVINVVRAIVLPIRVYPRRRFFGGFYGPGYHHHHHHTHNHMRRNVRGDNQIDFSEMREFLCISKGAVSQTISTLEKKGYVTRETNKENRRKVDVKVTEKGLSVLKDARVDMDDMMIQILKKFGVDNTKELISLLNKFADVMKESQHEEGMSDE